MTRDKAASYARYVEACRRQREQERAAFFAELAKMVEAWRRKKGEQPCMTVEQ